MNRFNRLWRSLKFRKQKLTRGWDDSETFSLDLTISKFVLPRLIRFKELTFSYPPDLTFEKWEKILDDMIYAFNANLKKFEFDEEFDWKRIKRGFKLFGKYYNDLWW